MRFTEDAALKYLASVVKPASTIEFASGDTRAESSAAASQRLALMIAWAPGEPERVGEVALFDEDGSARILGRGAPDSGGNERVVFVRQRPASTEQTPPLASPGLSREQLRIRVEQGKLRVEQIGKCALEVAGQRVDGAMIGPGESFLLKGQMLFYCTTRPRKLEPLRVASLAGTHAFGAPDVHGIVGESATAWRLRDQLAWMGKADGHTLLLGTSGSGKELCARAVHAWSNRARGPFVARNAATIPAGIIDAELFGNVKNYPNPGMAERPGLIGSADGGTLFLDEIGELPPNLQANLLRVLDEGGEYHNLGGTTTKRADFRLLGATNRAPESLKHDLAARLILHVTVPGLNERREDIPLLVRHLLRRALAKSPEVVSPFFSTKQGASEPNLRASLIESLLHHSYTTNIRELDALLWRAMAASSGAAIDCPADMTTQETHVLAAQRADDDEMELGPDNDNKDVAEPTREITEMEIRATLAEHKGNIVRAAKALGLSSRYVLYRHMKKYGIVEDRKGPERS